MATLDNKIWDEQPDEPLPPIELEESQRWSKEIGELVGALAAAQLEFETVTRDTKNPYYSSKYADLSAIVAGTQKALAKQGLVLIQRPEVLVGKQMVVLTSTLAHKSGQWIENKLTLPAIMLGKDGKPRFDAQSCGSAMTYARRYSYQSLVGVAAEPDDDGNKGVGMGSSEEAKAVGNKKVAELIKPDPGAALFFVWPTEADGRYAQVTGDRKLQEANLELLRHNGQFSKIDAKDPGHWTIPADKFDDLKYQLEQRNVRFEKLKAK